MSIRNAAKAIVIFEDKVLLNHCRQPGLGEYYTLPGGGQNQYETVEEAVVRECLEETGYTVAVRACAALYEEIHMDERFRSAYPDYAHKIFHIFRCSLACTAPVTPLEIDTFELGSEWIGIADIPNIRLLPEAVHARFTELLTTETPLWLGSRRLQRMV